MKIKKLIMSRGRPQNIPALIENFPFATLCIAKGESEDYREWPGEVLYHPDDVVGLSVTRQWILEYFREKNCGVFYLDDDIKGVYSVVSPSGRKIDNPNDIDQLIDNAAQCSCDAGIPLFGFSISAQPHYFKSSKPFYLSTWLAGAFGVHAFGDLNFDTNLKTREDVDIAMQCLRKYRIVWKDARFSFQFALNFNDGGAQALRTKDLDMQSVGRLKKKWGGALRLVNNKSTTLQTYTRVPRHSVHVVNK